MRRRSLLPWLFVAPTVAGLLIFTIGPIVAMVGISFLHWDLLSSPKFAGLSNYRDLVADQTVLVSIGNTLLFTVAAVTIQLVLSLALALSISQRLPRSLKAFLRSAFFFPMVLSAASISIVMSYLFDQRFGAVNYYLGKFGVDHIPWLTSGQWAMCAVVIAYVWQQFGFTFLILLGGISALPSDVLEAADIDGAAGFRRLLHITLPLISPSILVATVVATIHALEVFDQPYVMTMGGPGDSTRTMVMVIYRDAFGQLNFGGASAVSMLLLTIIALVTLAQFRLSRRFVFYR